MMAFCVVSALVPDLDASESKAKHIKIAGIKPLVPVATAIHRDFGHRGSLHSLLGWIGWTGFILPLGPILGWAGIAALSLGYAGHLAGDACTHTGIPLLYPQRRRCHLLPEWLRVLTGSAIEAILFAAFVLLAASLLLLQAPI